MCIEIMLKVETCFDEKNMVMSIDDQRHLNFEKEERILCFHGPLLYEAKVSKLYIFTYSHLQERKSHPSVFCPRGIRRS